MHQWLGLGSFLQTVLRVAVVWLGFYGAGKLLSQPLRIRKNLPLLPPEITGILAFGILSVLLSIPGIMTRTVCAVSILIMAVPGAFILYGRMRSTVFSGRITPAGFIWSTLLLGVVVMNLTHASMTNLAFDDPLVTYAVQPDRWLNAGRIFWLDETIFSGYPLLYEITSIWPASLSADRLSQLSILQVFQMSMLILGVFRGLQILRISRKLRKPVLITVLLSTQLYMWGSMAKPDTFAVMLCTLALACSIGQGKTEGIKLSSWLLMGMALAVKQTAVLVLIPFSFYSLRGLMHSTGKLRMIALTMLCFLPVVFGVRTMIHTGSPTYPTSPVRSLLNQGYEIDYPDENRAVNSRSSYVYTRRLIPGRQIAMFFTYMEGNILLLLAGVIAALLSRSFRKATLFLPFLVYSAAAILLFWPPWWGAKYTIIIYPFTALLGAHLLGERKAAYPIAAAVAVVSFIIPGFVFATGDQRPFSYRRTVTQAVLTGEWNSPEGYRIPLSTPEGMTQIWANSAYGEETVIFSLLEEKRYFFDGTVIVGWRHPVGQELYRDNTLEEEMDVLRQLDVDLVGFYRNDPAVLDQEMRIELLDHIGTDMALEPLIVVDGDYLLCRFNGDYRR